MNFLTKALRISVAVVALGAGTAVMAPAASAQPAAPLAIVYYQLVARHSGKCMDVTDVSMSNNAKLQQYACHGRGNQLFTPYFYDGYSRWTAAHRGRCVTVRAGSLANNAQIIQDPCIGVHEQQWRQTQPPPHPAPVLSTILHLWCPSWDTHPDLCATTSARSSRWLVRGFGGFGGFGGCGGRPVGR
ncbi:RICIN domain-containing protein [Micromonospora sp. NBC_01699]|uniref:RICIN domain-containing protein n=1 Tax=Micromonospora sp. NBC_01699 TaxID=2975984 RepID=UPI003FA5E65C